MRLLPSALQKSLDILPAAPYVFVMYAQPKQIKSVTNSQLTYVVGDATRPIGDGYKIIVHCCNDIGAWGSGFVLSLSQRWREPERQYRGWARHAPTTFPFKLGQVQFVWVEKDIEVANLIGQHGIRSQNRLPPIRYSAIREGFDRIATYALNKGASVHMPKLGSERAGGDWNLVADIVARHLVARGISVTVYNYFK